MTSTRFLFAAQIALISVISFVSKFSIPEFKDANWDTVLFLTPIGILKNFTADSSALRSFYVDVSSGQIQFEAWQWAAVTGLYLIAAFAGVLFLRRTANAGGSQ